MGIQFLVVLSDWVNASILSLIKLDIPLFCLCTIIHIAILTILVMLIAIIKIINPFHLLKSL